MLLLLNLFDDNAFLPAQSTNDSIEFLGELLMGISFIFILLYVIHKLLPKSLTQSAQKLPKYMPIHHEADVLIQNNDNYTGTYNLSENRFKKIGILALISISVLTIIFRDIRF